MKDAAEGAQRSVELEGRFGAFKVLAITFFKLRGGDFGRKDVDKLKASLETATNTHELARLHLDLLGEAYDDWRHALEHDRRIVPGNDLWGYYEQLLQFFLKVQGLKVLRNSHGRHRTTIRPPIRLFGLHQGMGRAPQPRGTTATSMVTAHLMLVIINLHLAQVRRLDVVSLSLLRNRAGRFGS